MLTAESLARKLWKVKVTYAKKQYNCDCGTFDDLNRYDQSCEIAVAAWLIQSYKPTPRP